MSFKLREKIQQKKGLFPRWIMLYCGTLKSDVVHLPLLKVVHYISVQNRFIASIFTLISCFSVHSPSKYLEALNGYMECFKSWLKKWALLWGQFDWLILFLCPVCESLWLHSSSNELLDLNFLLGVHTLIFHTNFPIELQEHFPYLEVNYSTNSTTWNTDQKQGKKVSVLPKVMS